MIKEGCYSYSELKRMLTESTKNEFKPNIPSEVTSGNKKNNRKAVKDITDQTKKLEGGIVHNTAKNQERDDYNKNLLDYDYATDPGKEYKDRVKKLVTNSALTQYDKESGASIDGNEQFYKSAKKLNKQKNKIEQDIKSSGLTAREMDSKAFVNNSLFGECKGMKRLNFKNTIFLSESEVLKKVPDQYKTDGNKFFMRDASGTDYLVECTVNEQFGLTQISILNVFNKKQINEEMDRMKQLYEYTRSENTTDKSRENDLHGMLEKIREIQK